MNSKISAAIDRYNMVEKGQKVAVALSGGADSVALLHSLCSMADALGITVMAAHLNHGIRGEEALRDEEFCREFCRKMGVELVVGNADVPAESAKTGESEELCARRLRYDFLEALDADVIATAHTASDTAETMLFNLARGGGIKALAGIPFKRGRIIRPLLEVTRQEIEDYCQKNGLEYVTDSTNLSDEYTRNRIRHNITPQMKQINSAFEQNAARTASLLREDADYLDSVANKEYENLFKEGRLSLKAGELHPSLLGRVAARFVEEQTDLAHESCHIEAVTKLIKNGSGAVQLKNGMEAQAARGWLWVFKREETTDFCIQLKNGTNSVPGYEITAEFLNVADIKEAVKINKLLLNGSIDYDKIVGKPVIRNRRAGDALKPKGRGVTKTLKNIFAELDIPFENRDSVPMIADDEGVLWIPGVRVAERAAADNGSKNIIFIKEYKPI